MLANGSNKKYIFYAIGEILLVMIGILLALQVNNWNQDRIEHKLERKYLENFLLDLKTDSICMDRNKQALHNDKKPGLQLVKRLLEGEEIFAQDSIKLAIRNSAYLGWALINERSRGTIDDIVSSGNMKLISNQHLRLAILEYYSFWDHAYERQDQRKSNYSNLTYKLFPETSGIQDSRWFQKCLQINKAEIEFRKEFQHELKYTDFLENVTLYYLSLRWQYVVHLVQMELGGIYDSSSVKPIFENW